MAVARVAGVPATRLVSLDVFRGLTMAAMVVVNNPGDWNSVYAPLLHAPWHGWTPTDLIFPFFLFIVGVSITLSGRSASVRSILKRGAIIFAVGLFLAAFPRFDWSGLRIPGVLQRIAVCYTVAALSYRWLQARSTSGPRESPSAFGLRHSALTLCPLISAVLLGYWSVMLWVPPPGGVAGDLSPDGNLGAHIDRALMSGHLWRPTWDPEGLLSTVPAIGTTLFGVLAGLWIRRDRHGDDVGRPRAGTAATLAIAGVVATALGLLWDLVFPINKNLWTSSYVMLTAGLASMFLALCYWMIDVKGWRAWTKPFVILGVNALALFVLSALLVKTLSRIHITLDDGRAFTGAGWLYTTFFEPIASPKNASLLYALAHLALLFLVLWWMYRRRIFLKA
jgi:predicted acyltransferase